MTARLPFGAERVPAKQRRFNETVVFVHHFGGSRRTVLRHLRMVNDLGFDGVRFDLIFSHFSPQERLPITGDLRFGIRHIWANQIESLLNSIPGRKILYSFSMPSCSVAEAIGKRHAHDISAWICDGGPFLQMPRCMWNLYEQEYHVKSRLLRAGFTAASMLLWGVGYTEQMKRALSDLPEDFPVLSIRGWKDRLVPVAAIDEFFALQSHLDLEVLTLPEATHLKGLRDFPGDYIARVEAFLGRVARPSQTLEHPHA